ncbi:MAG TPA: hypothetical protein VD764_08980 [Nocardioides sp.]|nr:hypothetical protein [Nocardioides sp.]
MGPGALPSLPAPSAVSVEQVAALAAAIETWAEAIDDVDALEEARAQVAAIETYLRRRHNAASADIARADRRLEVRIGTLLAPPRQGRRTDINGDTSSGTKKLNPGRENEFRRIAAHADDLAVAEAIERGASRSEVLRTIQRGEVQAQVDDGREFLESLPPSKDPEGDLLRARVYDSILAVEDAAKDMERWTVDDIRWAIESESLAHVRQLMTARLTDSLSVLGRFSEVTS